MRWQLFALCTVLAIICTVHCPCPACRLAAASLCYWARVFHSSVFAKHARFAVICADFAYTYRDTAYGATATTIPATTVHKVFSCAACSQKSCASAAGVAKSKVEVRCSAQINKKRGQQKEFQRRRGLPARRARAGVPESHRPPPGATPRGPGRSGFPATSQRGSEVYGPHIIRAGHGRVRCVARVTARGGAVRDADHQFLPVWR